MIDTKEQVARHLSTLIGLDVSGVAHATDMLTLQFGPLREVRTSRGTIKHLGDWALHIQCDWRIEQGNAIVTSHSDFAASEESTRTTTHRIRDLLVNQGPTAVLDIEAGENGNAVISLARGMRLVILADAIADDEDWRLFPSNPDAKHFVIEGGKVDPSSL
ncbi:hypothetical protein [Paraburkholderia atlantica]|uniref:Uncharacterized protein n=1 Tax=Paraburkholderia atlantica TaxID=2654982 RepID=D5WF66_PARAM|nr:hypothetical protein [Paraburkholderia atlantica]ADG17371.1 conserved hypothetical protein [Paraburkholderia atlantica]MBB5507420.1 hypothetical protein [Paraburkholderia atlantica]